MVESQWRLFNSIYSNRTYFLCNLHTADGQSGWSNVIRRGFRTINCCRILPRIPINPKNASIFPQRVKWMVRSFILCTTGQGSISTLCSFPVLYDVFSIPVSQAFPPSSALRWPMRNVLSDSIQRHAACHTAAKKVHTASMDVTCRDDETCRHKTQNT